MEIEIKKLTPDLTEDYLRFFESGGHDGDSEAGGCYCVCWSSSDDPEEVMSTPEKRRALAKKYVEGDILRGYLAYLGGAAAGWCNANTKSECIGCRSWKLGLSSVEPREPDGARVKSVFCFAVASGMRRKGIAAKLLERVCADAADDGFDFAEAYPNKDPGGATADNFMGYIKMYERMGFHAQYETENKIVMRKNLSEA